MRKFSVAAVTLLLSACAVGPDYQAPPTPEPDAFNAAETTAASREQAEQQFWAGFEDPLLGQLIDQTLAANHSLQAGLARYDRAAALLYGAKREQWPSITASASGAEQQLADVERTPPGAGPERVERYQAGLAANWELDLFGRLRRATQSQQAELQAAGADLGALQVALVGQLASSYFELRGLQQQLQVAEQNVALQEETLDIVSARVDAGRGTEFDRVRARSQLQRTRAALPTLRAGIRAAMHRIAVLTGQPPAALIATLERDTGLPGTLPVIPVDSPGDVLRRRPDIAAAEARGIAAEAVRAISPETRRGIAPGARRRVADMRRVTTFSHPATAILAERPPAWSSHSDTGPLSHRSASVTRGRPFVERPRAKTPRRVRRPAPDAPRPSPAGRPPRPRARRSRLRCAAGPRPRAAPARGRRCGRPRRGPARSPSRAGSSTAACRRSG